MHEHDWRPVDGEHAAYRCSTCDALGRRDLRSGKIIMARRPVAADIDRRPLTWSGGRIAKKPDADRQAEQH